MVRTNLLLAFESISGMLPGMSGAIGLPGEVVTAPTERGIRHGVRKINVDTDGRLAITAAVRKALAGELAEWDPRHATRAARQGMPEVVAERRRQFGQAGDAADYLPLSPERMRECYVATAAAA